MTAADHLRDLLLARSAVGNGVSERTNALAAGKGHRCFQRALGDRWRHRRSIVRVDPRCLEGVCDASRAESASCHRARACFGKCAVVDIAEIGHPRSDRLRIGGRPIPATFADLALKIRRELVLRRREPPYVSQRQLLERVPIQRRGRAA